MRDGFTCESRLCHQCLASSELSLTQQPRGGGTQDAEQLGVGGGGVVRAETRVEQLPYLTDKKKSDADFNDKTAKSHKPF